jgi:hypothetical protein
MLSILANNNFLLFVKRALSLKGLGRRGLRALLNKINTLSYTFVHPNPEKFSELYTYEISITFLFKIFIRD